MTAKHRQSAPVVRASAGSYELAALVGDGTVILGWTMDDYIDRTDLLGFAVKRMRRCDDMQEAAECRWLPNHRRFATPNDAGHGADVSTQSDPLQQFYFVDYAIEPRCAYTYSVVPVRGTPNLKYFEAPVSVTVRPHDVWLQDSGRAELLAADGAMPRDGLTGPDSALVICGNARQNYRYLGVEGLANEVQRLTDQARSAVFLYSTSPLAEPVMRIVSQVNSGRLLYGMTPGQENAGDDGPKLHNTVHLSRPTAGQRLEPVGVYSPSGTEVIRYTSALVTDPWSRSPEILLWSDTPRASADDVIETRTVSRDKRSAARLATSIFHAYTEGRLPKADQMSVAAGRFSRRLEPDGRWSNIYFSRHASSHKFREREIFSGHP
ncbi:MAG: hypothetical protein AAGA61_04705 [Pseudomonadota bacterium]